jgi:hypothetical protein
MEKKAAQWEAHSEEATQDDKPQECAQQTHDNRRRRQHEGAASHQRQDLPELLGLFERMVLLVVLALEAERQQHRPQGPASRK